MAKSKDDETGTVHAFKLDVVTVGRDVDGDDITSCVAAPDTTMDAVKRAKLPSGGNQKIAFDTLSELFSKSAEVNHGGESGQGPYIRMDEAIGVVAARLPGAQAPHRACLASVDHSGSKAGYRIERGVSVAHLVGGSLQRRCANRHVAKSQLFGPAVSHPL